MFPVAHGWLVAQVIATPTPASFLGCVWPDMLFESPLTHPQSHRSGAQLLAFARDLPAGAQREEFIAFVAGVITHGVEPHGFDWFSDEVYGDAGPQAKGFAFQRGAPLAERAAAACDVPLESGLWKAHNLIEMAFERSLRAEHLAANAALADACADTALMARIAKPLARTFAREAADLARPMRRFLEMVEVAPTSLDALASAYARQTRAKHPGARPDAAKIAALIGEAEALVAPERADYLTTCVAGVRATLAAFGL